MEQNKRRVLINLNRTIRETIKAIDMGELGIALVVDGQDRLQGTVTDGDVRRAILRGVNLDEPVSTIMTAKPLTVTPNTDIQGIRQMMLQTKMRHIPVVDEDGRVLDLVVVSDFLAIPLSHPDISDREIQAVLEVLRTPNLSMGPKLLEFEELFASYIGTRYAIAVNSGTSGLHLCIKALGIHDKDEVITTPFSFIASANCILFEDATPVFVDINPITLNIDVTKIEEKITPRTKAILPVHVFGHPCDMTPLKDLAKRHGLYIIEDACEAIGAQYKGRKVGTFGQCAVFGFYPNKQITTGEGGVIVTDNENIAKLCRSFRNQGRSEEGGWLCHERLGYNYRLSEIQCALGIAQIERIEEILAKRQAVASYYSERLKRVEGIQIPYVSDKVRMSWFVYVIRLNIPGLGLKERDEVISSLRKAGIASNNYFPPIHLQPFYQSKFGYKEGRFPETERASQATIALPFYNNLEHAVIDQICDVLEKSVAAFL